MSSPFRAPSDVEMAMTSGIARPRACGQAMTSTVAVRTSAPSGSPSSHQPTRVIAPAREGDVEQEGGGPVGQRLRAGRRRLRLRDQAHDPGQGRLVAGRGDLDPERAAGGDGAGDDLRRRAAWRRRATRR